MSEKLSFFYIEMFPAGYGDCFMVRCYDGKDKTNILIDGGFTYTFNEELKPYLQKEFKDEAIDLLVVTHIDADHIAGVIKFIKVNRQKEFNIEIKEVWHNSYRHLDFEKDASIEVNSELSNNLANVKSNAMNQEAFTENKKAGKFIGGLQGSSLAKLLSDGNYNWNFKSGGIAISIENIANPIKINEYINIILLSPNKLKLSELKEEWLKELRAYKLGDKIIDKNTIFDDALEFLLLDKGNKIKKQKGKVISASNKSIESLLEDFKSVKEEDRAANGSSIAFVLEFNISGVSKKALFLGDAHPSVIISSLNKYYLHNKDENGFYNFDLIKISHHGCEGNSVDLLDCIDSENYIISTNGENYNHPDETTIAKIVGRKTNTIRKLYFNYSTETSEKFNDSELKLGWKNKYKYEVFYTSKINLY